MSSEKNFGYLGYPFQLKLIAHLLTDIPFAETIIDQLYDVYFDDQYVKVLINIIKEHHRKYATIPDFSTLEEEIKIEVDNDIIQKYLFDTLNSIKETSLKDGKFVKDKTIKFCKQQELKKAIGKIQKILEKGDFESYDKCEGIIKKALEVGETLENGVDVFENVDFVLSDDYRDPIPSGVKGFDVIMGGGLAKGEVAVGIAPLGAGKSTLGTKIANTAHGLGKNVVQIIFEDKPKEIQRKHYACWSKIELNELGKNKAKVLELVSQHREASNGQIIIKKFSPIGTTMEKIRNYLNKLKLSGVRIDVVVLDYIDCVSPQIRGKEEYSTEGEVMREFEALVEDFNVAGWTFVQGNRSSLGADVVTTDKIGGSIKKAQFGHFIFSIARTLPQREARRATIAILKSRFGVDGIVYENIKFDNTICEIDTDDSSEEMSFMQHSEHKEEKKVARVQELLNKKRQNETEAKL